MTNRARRVGLAFSRLGTKRKKQLSHVLLAAPCPAEAVSRNCGIGAAVQRALVVAQLGNLDPLGAIAAVVSQLGDQFIGRHIGLLDGPTALHSSSA